MARNSILLLWLLSVLTHPASATPLGSLRLPGSEAEAGPCGEHLSRQGAYKASVRGGSHGSPTGPVPLNPTGLVLMWRLGESAQESARADGLARARRVQRRRSVTEKQLMNDKAHTMYARQRLLWLKSVMGHLNTAARRDVAPDFTDQISPEGGDLSVWENMFGPEESPDFDVMRADIDGGGV